MRDQTARRRFIRSENERLEKFFNEGGSGPLIGWHREYRCDCGVRCGSPGDIWDHTQTCNPPENAPGQASL